MAHLSIFRDATLCFKALLDRSEVILGHGDDANVYLLGNGVSHHHAALRVAPDGQSWLLVDLSVTGTFLSGIRLEAEKEAPIKNGDKFVIGPNTILFEAAFAEAGLATMTLNAPRAAGRVVQLEGERLKVEHGELVVVAGPDKGRRYTITGSSAEVGKEKGCALQLTDPTVSKRHLKIEANSRGFTVKDLHSTNGTLVGDRKITEGTDLVKDSTISLGATVLRFGVKAQTQTVPASPSQAFEAMVGRSAAMQRVMAAIEKVAPHDCPVLILGETGTGKELAARALHARSNRAMKPMVIADCTVLDSEVVNAELFGHEKGAFTGAHESKAGLFEQADGGTLFFDELGELPLDTQKKLLRVVQTGEVRRVGGTREKKVDVRILAATNQDLPAMVKRKQFREELYFRLNVVPVILPPLRDRMEDVPTLVDHFLARMAKPGAPVRISDAARALLQKHDWPGNVRELEHRLQRAMVRASGAVIEEADVRADPQEQGRAERPEPTKEEIVAAMEKYRKVARAAGALGVSRQALYRRMKALGIKGKSRRLF